MHDLIEDTEYDQWNDVPLALKHGMENITKIRDENYIDYIKKYCQ